ADYDAAAVVGLAHGWCYAVADQTGTTFGFIHDGALPRPQMQRAIAETFGIARQVKLVYLGRRPAFPQSAAAPLRRRVIAIGDAAFSHDPIGGRGFAFALCRAVCWGGVPQSMRGAPRRPDTPPPHVE